MDRSISARRVATLVGDFDRSPAYAGLADALVLLIGDGRIPLGTRLPSERELTDALGVSRTTVTRAYAALRDAGYAEARQGSGTFTRVPGRPRPRPRPGAAPPARATATRSTSTAPRRPPRPGSRRRTPRRRPSCRRTSAATATSPPGCPSCRPRSPRRTTPAGCRPTPTRSWSRRARCRRRRSWRRRSPAAATGCWSRRRATPTPPSAIRHGGARLAPPRSTPTAGTSTPTARRAAPDRAAAGLPDPRLPEPDRAPDDRRRSASEYAAAPAPRPRRSPIVDEAHQALALEGQEMPRPFAAYAPDTITIGSASKSFWGGLRLGWIRAPLEPDGAADPGPGQPRPRRPGAGAAGAGPAARPTPTPILDAPPRPAARAARRPGRRACASSCPSGGSGVPDRRAGAVVPAARPPLGTALAAEAERHGVIIAPGPVFAAEGGLDRFVRIPWTRPVDELERGRAPASPPPGPSSRDAAATGLAPRPGDGGLSRARR